MDRFSDHEQRIRALEDFVRGFKSSLVPGPTSSSSSTSVVPTSQSGSRKSGTYAIYNRGASRVSEEQLKNVTLTIRNIPALKRWEKIDDVQKASLIFVLVFAPGGRIDIGSMLNDTALQGSAHVIGISLAAGPLPVAFPNNTLFTKQYNLVMDGTFMAVDTIKSGDQFAELQRLDPNSLSRMGSACTFCTNEAPLSRCANQCGALYCGQSCADADWVKGHAAACNKIGGNVDKAKPKPSVKGNEGKIWLDWAYAAPHFSRRQLDILAASGLIVTDFFDSTPQEIKDLFAQDFGFVITKGEAQQIQWAGRELRRDRF